MLTKSFFVSVGVVALLGGSGPAGAGANFSHVTYTQTSVAGGFGLVSAEAVDSSGNVYIVDGRNGQVWKETPGNGTYTQTQIKTAAIGPQGIVVDAHGNLFVSDYVSGSIFKETPTGAGYTESTAISGFKDPYALAIDGLGNLYVIDALANSLLKETLSGGKYTQSLISSTLNNATQVAVDSGGNVYVADSGNNRVVKETPAGGAYTESSIGTGLNQPEGVAVNSFGVVYVGDTNNYRILTETLVNGSYVQSVVLQGTGADTMVVADSDLYYADALTAVFEAVPNELAEAAAVNFGSAAVAGTAVTQSITFTFDVGGSLAATPYYVSTQGDAQLDFNASADQPATACLTGKVYATGATCTVSVSFSPIHPGWRYGAVVLFGSAGNPIGTAYLQGTGSAPQVAFSPGTYLGDLTGLPGERTQDIAVDSAKNVFFEDIAWGTRVRSYADPGSSSEPSAALIFDSGNLEGIGLDGAGNLLLVGGFNTSSSVAQYTLNPTVSSEDNRYNNVGFTFPGFNSPNAAQTDGSGDVFVSDYSSNTAFVETFAHGGYDLSPLGNGLSNTFGLSVDGNGAVYILDQGNNRLVKETPAGGTYTQSVLLTGLNSTNADVAVDRLGNLYLPDGASILKESLVNGSYTASTLAINSGSATLNANGRIVVDGAGNVLFTEVDSDQVSATLSEIDVADAPTLSFAATAVGAISSDSPKKLSIVNNGNSTLTFAAPPTAANPPITAGFTLSPTTTCPALPGSTASQVLAPGESCDLYINFAPTASGYISGTLTLTDNSLNAPGSKQVIKLNGQASGTSTSLPSVSLTPASSNYGTLAVGSSGSATFTLTNTGTVTVAITRASVSSGPFSIASSTCGANLAAAANCVYVVHFSPTAAGAASATFSVIDDAGTQTAALTGTGSVMTGSPIAKLTPTTGAFGNTLVGSTSDAKSFQLANSGTSTLTISSIEVGGTNADQFKIASNSCGSSLEAGASCVITVTFSPTDASAASAVLAVADNASNTPQTAALSGAGTADDFGITASPAAHIVSAGNSADYMVDVTSVVGNFSDPVTLSATGLPAGATVTFSPPSVTPGAAGTTSKMTIQTSPLVALMGKRILWSRGVPLLAVFLFIPWGVGRRARVQRSCWLALALLAASLSGCGNGGYALPQAQAQAQSKVYTVVITGTSGSLRHTTSVQLTVQQGQP